MAEQINFPVYDYSPKGIINDGSIDGLLKARIDNGSLVKLPYTSFRRSLSLGGSATSNSTTPSLYNSDGTSVGINFTNVTTIADTVVLSLAFKGTYCSIRYLEAIGGLPVISVTIDGVVYRFPKTRRNESTISFGSVEGVFIVDDNLDEGEHIITICRHFNPENTVNFTFHGLIVDSKNGYTPLPAIDQVYSSGLLTASAVNIPNTDTNTSFGAKAIKKIRYVNVSGAPATVTLNHATNLFDSKILAAGEIYEVSLSNTAFKIAELQHLSSVASAIRFFCIGIL